MPLTAGTTVGRYHVTGLLGAGGMSEVHRARDMRLNREVALKILPEEVALDAGRLGRFEREARALAALNHPNIAAIYSIEDSPFGQLIVMELVDGETLAAYLAARGPRTGVPWREAVAIALQVAAALDAAHEHGIVHRDLKPANIARRPDGTVKVLDFGLAKTIESSTGDASATRTALTGSGGIGPGTPAYMSPEQARGLAIDRRTDVWAFGCVLYELLTGGRAFDGASLPDVLNAVLDRQPDLNRLPGDTPDSIRRLLRRCLEKSPQRRLRDIGDAIQDLQDALAPQPVGAVPRRPSVWRRILVAAGLGIAAVGLLSQVPGLWRSGATPPTEPVRLVTSLPDGVSVARGPGVGSSVAVSPDGQTVVIAGSDREGGRLYVRRLAALETQPLVGSERGSNPFFSYDGKWVGFLADGYLKRVPIEGGTAVGIAPASGILTGASWGPDDEIVFGLFSGRTGQLHMTSTAGGRVETLSDIPSGFNPHVLPDGRGFLFEANGWISAFDRTTGQATRVIQGSNPAYAVGQLIFQRGTALLAAPFNLSQRRVTGAAVPLAERAAGDAGPSGSTWHIAVSAAGTLAYVAAPSSYALVLTRTDGTEQVLTDRARAIFNPQFSPDGRTVVASVGDAGSGQEDLWLFEPLSLTSSRLTFDGASSPVWMPNGQSVAYAHAGADRGIYRVPIGGDRAPERLFAVQSFHWLVGWTPDSRTLAYAVMDGGPSSIMALNDGEGRRIVGPGSIWGGRLSDDGRWLVYYTLVSGTFEVYVTSFPGGDGRWLIGEGRDPAWSPDGHEVFYRNGARLMAARIDPVSGMRVVSRRIVVEPFLPPGYDDYDVSRDGKATVIVRPADRMPAGEITIVVNWFTELRKAFAGS